MKASEPLSQFALLETGSVDRAEFILSRYLAACRIRCVADRNRFKLKMNGLQLGRVSLVFNRYESHSIVESELPGTPIFYVVGTGNPCTFHFGNRKAGTHGKTPVMVTGAQRMVIDRAGDSRMLAVRVRASDLEDYLKILTNSLKEGRLIFNHGVDLREGTGAAVTRLIRFVAEELDRDASLGSNPHFRRCYEEAILTTLLSLPHNQSDRLSAQQEREVLPGVVNRAQEYMRANLREPITVSDLLRLCECSRTTLFAAFRKAKGYSPMEFLEEQRLHAARQSLQEPTKATLVSSVAFECGFLHLGRFASTYAKRFGESPSQTLRKAK